MFKFLASFTFALGAYSYNYNLLQVKNPITSNLFCLLQNFDSSYSQYLLKILLTCRIFKSEEYFKDKVLGQGFDNEGKYLKELKALGFKGVQVGPVSLNNSESYEPKKHLGIFFTKANICSLRSSQKQQKGQGQQNSQNVMEIGVNIKQDAQVLKYTPYILIQNMLECMKQVHKNTNIQYVVINIMKIQEQLKKYPEYVKLKKTFENKQTYKDFGKISIFLQSKNGQKSLIVGQGSPKKQTMKVQELIQYLKRN